MKRYLCQMLLHSEKRKRALATTIMKHLAIISVVLYVLASHKLHTYIRTSFSMHGSTQHLKAQSHVTTIHNNTQGTNCTTVFNNYKE